jgi:hypothetical protein
MIVVLRRHSRSLAHAALVVPGRAHDSLRNDVAAVRFSPIPPKLDASFMVLCVTAAPAVIVLLLLPVEYAIFVTAGLALVLVLGLRRAWAIAVVVDGRGVLISDFFHRHAFTWEEVAAVELAPPSHKGFRKRIGFVLRDGSGVAPEATAVRPRKRDEFVRAVQTAAAGHEIEIRT